MKNHSKSLIAMFLMAIMLFLLSSCSKSTIVDNTAKDDTELQNQISSLVEEVNKLSELLTQKDEEEKEEVVEYPCYAEEAYEKLKLMDDILSNRDCLSGEDFVLCQKWIKSTLLIAGYSEDDISYQSVLLNRYVPISEDYEKSYPAALSVTVDGKTYSRQGRQYVENAEGTYTYATFETQNIILTKKGKSEKQIIVGMHYDGDGTGDNASSVALALTTAEHLVSVETPYTLKFVFFTAEEYGLYGSSAYANGMTEEEIANTLYMLNMDSLICGDYCYLYGGQQDNDTKTVTKTEAYDNAMKIANEIGLSFRSNPWTWDNLSPDDEEEGIPSYASPSTGNWSDHAPFEKLGITYLYFEATNWDIPDYTGYGETYFIGMLMNTENDYLSYIEKYFPGRPLHHLTVFSTLLNQLLTTEYPYNK